MNRRALFSIAMVAAFVTVAAPALAGNKPSLEGVSEIMLDIDNDGRMDRAVLVDGFGGTMDLYIYLAVGDEKRDLLREPAFLKKEITKGSIIDRGLESKGKGSLIVKSCYGCGAMKSWDETLTIVHRGGEFLVAGFTRDWEWNSHTSDGNVETIMGGCDINFLSGNGVASQGLGKAKPVRGKFTPIKLADSSEGKYPKACKF